MNRNLSLQRISFLVLSLSLLLAGCQKYEDGPAISLQSRENRVANNWKVPFFSRNQIDVTLKYDSLYYDFGKDGKFTWTQKLAGQPKTVLVGTWLLVDADTHLRMIYDKALPTGEEMLQANILELRGDQMRISYVFQGNEYAARLIPR